MQGHGHIIAPDFCVAHREANSGLSTLNRTKSILSIYHQQRQLQKQRGMCLNGTYPFCQQPLSGNCHIICFVKPVLWTATPGGFLFLDISRCKGDVSRLRARAGIFRAPARGTFARGGKSTQKRHSNLRFENPPTLYTVCHWRLFPRVHRTDSMSCRMTN